MKSSLRIAGLCTATALTVMALTIPSWAETAPAPAKGPTPSAPTLMPAATTPAGMPGTPFPGGPNPMNMQNPPLPKFLEGVVTIEEFQAFNKFKMDVNESPEIKEVLVKITALRQQIQQLQGEIGRIREKALTDNPAMKAIADRMQHAMMAHSPMPPAGMQFKPMPAPLPPQSQAPTSPKS